MNEMEVSDQANFITEGDMSLLKEVDDMVERSVVIGDPLLAFEYGHALGKGIRMRGLALAKLLFRLKESWELFRSAGIEDDLETMANIHMGIDGQTTTKYVDMWESIFENPNISEETKKALQGRGVRDLLLLKSAVREGNLDDEDLKDIAVLDSAGIRDRIREVRGSKTSSNSAIRILIQMQDGSNMAKGTIYAKQGNLKVILGYILDLELLSGDDKELAQKAWERIKNAAGVVEVFNGS